MKFKFPLEKKRRETRKTDCQHGSEFDWKIFPADIGVAPTRHTNIHRFSLTTQDKKEREEKSPFQKTIVAHEYADERTSTAMYSPTYDLKHTTKMHNSNKKRERERARKN